MKTTFLEFVWIWDKIHNLNLPKHHCQMGRFLSKLFYQPERRQAMLMAFRNSGKSTLIGLFCAWILTQKPNTKIMVLSADHTLAKKMVSHIKRIIERHPLCHELKPPHPTEWASDRFTILRSDAGRDPSVLARGLMANMTGCRADIIICDDVEVPKTCDTSAKRSDLRQKLSELDYILAPNGCILYVGTPHCRETIYTPTKKWQTLRIPILDEEGHSNWPERFSCAQIEQIRRASTHGKFFSQMMLEPISIEQQRLDDTKLIRYTDELNYYEANQSAILKIGSNKLCSGSAWWDPSFGKSNGDRSVIAAVFMDENGRVYIHRIQYMVVPEQTEATQYQCQQVVQFLQQNMLPAVHLETNGIGRFLPALLRQELTRQHLGCAVIEHTSTQHKADRILGALEPLLLNGALYAHNSIWDTPFIHEMQDFSPAHNRHDDGLDAVSGCILSEPIHLKRLPNFYKIRPLWR